MGVQALIGVIAVEYAWKRTKRFREVDEKRDAQFPHFRRTDVQHWARWKFYPGAMLMMPTRLVLLVVDAMFLTLMITILTIGHDFKKGPIKKGCRKNIINFLFYVCSTFFQFLAGVSSNIEMVDYDYSYYLGENYDKSNKKSVNTSTIVSNHTSWLDPVVYTRTMRPAFAPSAEFENVPLVGTLSTSIDSIFIPRGGSEEKKAKALLHIRER